MSVISVCLGVVLAAAGVISENLFDNGEFDRPGEVWQVCGKGKTERRETAPMSGEWIYRTTGNSYNFLRGAPRCYEPGIEYTMEVRARGVNAPATLSVLELYRKEDGKVGEGALVADKVRLGDTFRVYRFPFVSSKRPLFSFMFYKWDPKTDDGGIDIASVALYKGRLSSLEFRPLNRVGRKAAVPGTEVPLPRNSYGRRKDRLLALALVPRDRDVREVKEVFNGLNAEVDVLVTTGADQDIYETDSDGEEVARRLKERRYGLFIVTMRASDRVGERLYASIADSVRSGAGIYFLKLRDPGRFAPMLAESALKPVADGSLARAFPGGIFEKSDVDFDPADLVEGRFGRGRVIAETAERRSGLLKLNLQMPVQATSVFPFGRFADPYLARLFYRAAGMDGCDAPAVRKVKWLTVDSTGRVRASGVAADAALALAEAKARPTTSGRHLVAMRMMDAQGYALDYDAVVVERPGPRISSLNAIETSVSGDTPAVFAAEVEDAAGCTLSWTLEDFSGRIIGCGAAAAGEQFKVPTERLYTNMGILRLELAEGKLVRDVKTAPVYARDRDRARTDGDFTPSIWGAGLSLSRDTFRQFERHLEDVGFRASVLPVRHGGYAQSLRNGMALGGDALGDDSVFRPSEQKGNVHAGGLNTEAGRAKIRRFAAAEAARGAPYGVTQYMLTDEPNFTLRYTADELDEAPGNIAEYRRRMSVKYGTIAQFNRRHATTYASFGDLRPGRLAEARETGRFAEFVEWRNFNVDRWCEAIKSVADEAKAHDPTARLSLANSFGQTAFSANDYWKILTCAGLGFSNEYTAMVYFRRDAIFNFDEFYRSFRPDMRVWGYVGYAMTEAQVRFMPWWFAAHRYGGFTWFSACGKDFRIFTQPDLAYTRDAADLKDALEKSKLMDGLGRLMLSAGWKKPEVAIYYSHESLLVATLLGKERKSFEILNGGPLHDYMYSRQGAQYLTEDLLHQFDFISPQQVAAGALKNYKALLMPRIKALSDAEVEAVRSFVAAGGRVLVDESPGGYDELGMKRGAAPFTAAQLRVTGANFDDLDFAQRGAVRDFLSAAGVEPVVKCDGIVERFGREAMRWRCGKGELFAYLRMPGRSKGVAKDELQLPVCGYVYDPVGGKFLGRTERVCAELDEGGAAVYSVLGARPAGVRVKGVPDEIERGGELRLALALDVPRDLAPDTVFNVRFVSPSGACRFHMRRNVDAPGGRAEVVFPTAYNDACGEWRVVVRDALTGLAAEKRFLLK